MTKKGKEGRWKEGRGRGGRGRKRGGVREQVGRVQRSGPTHHEVVVSQV